MKLLIVTLRGTQFDGDIESLNIKTTAGEITVLNNHLPLITELVSGQAIITKKEGEKMEFKINSGFLEVSGGNRVVILAR